MDLTAFDHALKEHYTADRVLNMVYEDNPLLAMIPKMEDFGGRNLRIVTIYGDPQGRSATFSRAQARSSTTAKIEDFVLTRVKDYSVGTIDNETMEASKGDANAFMDAATTEIDGAINALTRSLAIAMYKSGYGEIGTVGSFSTTTITLSEANDVTNFEIGQELVLSLSQASNTLKALGSSGNGLIITGVNRSTGVLTFGYNVDDSTNGIPTIANGDVIFVRGDREDSATPSRTKLAGLEAWIPQTAPTSTTFFGVNRAVDPTRLAGLRKDYSNVPIEEALIDGAAILSREGHKIDHYFMNYTKYANLEKALGSKVQYIDMKVTAEISFRGIVVNGTKGPIKCVPDQNCPNDRIFGMYLPYWKLYSLGKAPRVIDTDGLSMLRQASADGVEFRYGYYANMGCKGPGSNINIKV